MDERAKRLTVLAVLVVCCTLAGAQAIDVPLRVESSRGSRSTMAGDFALDGQQYHMSFSVSSDGPAESKPGMVYFTANKDEGYMDWQAFPDVLGVGGKLFRVQFEGKRVALTPFEGDVGAVSLALETQRVSLMQRSRPGSVLLYRPGLRTVLPVGKYILREYQLEHKDSSGTPWYLCARGGDNSPVLEVVKDKDKVAALNIGGPYVPMASINERSLRNFKSGSSKDLRLDFVLQGVRQENAAQVYPIGRRNRSSPPSFTIRDDSNAIVARGSFRYG